MRPLLPLLLCILVRLASAGKGKGKGGVCKDFSCCAPDDDAARSLTFLVAFDDPLPDYLCTSLKRQLELDFVVAYNYLARLNCDKPCFRRATDARVVSQHNFVHCPYDRQRHLQVQQEERTMLIEIDMEQSGSCETALDGASTNAPPVPPRLFANACGHPAWAWDFSFSPDRDDVCSPYEESKYCCCVCGVDRPLVEAELAAIYSGSVALTTLSTHVTSVRELAPREPCGQFQQTFTTITLVNFDGNTEGLDPSTSADLYNVFSSGYNALTFDNCDPVGRVMGEGVLTPVSREGDASARRLQFRVNLSFLSLIPFYARSFCPNPSGCTIVASDVEKQCTSDECTDESESATNAYENDIGGRRGLIVGESSAVVDELVRIERHLQGSRVAEIRDQCFCPIHTAATGASPTVEQFRDDFNQNLSAEADRFGQVGLAQRVEEFTLIPAAGPPVDWQVWLPVYFQGSPCDLDEAALQALADTVMDNYNDMAAEDCDKPLFRQIIRSSTWMDPNLDCNRHDFVAHIYLQLRCHGRCSPYDLLFGDYRFHRGLGEKKVPYNPVEYQPELQSMVMPVEFPEASQEERKTSHNYQTEEFFGFCPVSTTIFQSPSPEGLEARINAELRTSDVSSAAVLYSPLCRCEDPDESFYPDPPPLHFQHFHTENGIYVIPYTVGACRNRRLGDSRQLTVGEGLFSCFAH
jgi:hypothetical protein